MDALVIFTHVWSRITCRWHFEWLSTAVWSAMAHAPATTGVLVCVGIGWFAYERLPASTAALPPSVVFRAAAPVNAPEPWSMAILAFGVAALVAVKYRR